MSRPRRGRPRKARTKQATRAAERLASAKPWRRGERLRTCSQSPPNFQVRPHPITERRTVVGRGARVVHRSVDCTAVAGRARQHAREFKALKGGPDRLNEASYGAAFIHAMKGLLRRLVADQIE